MTKYTNQKGVSQVVTTIRLSESTYEASKLMKINRTEFCERALSEEIARRSQRV